VKIYPKAEGAFSQQSTGSSRTRNTVGDSLNECVCGRQQSSYTTLPAERQLLISVIPRAVPKLVDSVLCFVFPIYISLYILRVMVPWLRTDHVVQLLVFLVVLVTHSSSESKSTTAALLGKIKWRSIIKWTNLWIKTKRRISQKQDANPEISMTSVNIPFLFYFIFD
jgi:hypothetical protein